MMYPTVRINSNGDLPLYILSIARKRIGNSAIIITNLACIREMFTVHVQNV